MKYYTSILFYLTIGIFLFHANSSFCGQARGLCVKWENTVSPCDGQSDVNLENGCYYWDLEMDDHFSTSTKDYTVYASELTDDYLATWGNDHQNSNIDDGDATLLCAHGHVDDTNWLWWKASLSTSSGNGYGTCRSYVYHMRFGNNDAEIVHLMSCYSLHHEMIVNNVWPNHTAKNRTGATYGLHKLTGYHGGAESDLLDKLDDMADDGWDGSVTKAWVIHMSIRDFYDPPVGGGTDLCAQGMTMGNNETDAFNRYYPQSIEIHCPTNKIAPHIYSYCSIGIHFFLPDRCLRILNQFRILPNSHNPHYPQ